MTVYGKLWGVVLARLPLVITVAGVGVVGCGRPAQQPAQQKAEASATPAPPGAAGAKETPPAQPQQPARANTPSQRSFAEATRSEPPADWPPPPDVTRAGKSVGKLYTEVVKVWDGVHFVTPAGKRVVHHAILDTEQGVVDIELRPDWAPNHVRNFVALARVGYYDGLVFERTIHQESDVQPGDKLDLIEAGCPLGTGESGTGSIGYWLKPEFNAQVHHEEGTVGACRGEEADTAGCRFYISLCKAPFLDGNYTVFGKVAGGLDVARKIFTQPVKEDEQGEQRPLKPVVINKVTIQTKEVDKQGPGGDN
jgi:peptidyl-prolyl cis-trans isomerase B (cyclophilin B)